MHKKFLLFGYLGMTVVFIWLFLFINQVLINNKVNEIRFLLNLVSDNVSGRLDSVQEMVEIAAGSSDVTEGEPAVAEAYLKKIVDGDTKMWSHMLMTDLQGTEYVHTEGASHYGTSLKDREYYTVPARDKSTVIAQPIFSVSTRRKIIAIGTPVFVGEEMESVLVGFVHLSYISQLLNQNGYTKNSYLMMMNLDGTISAHPNERFILVKKINELIDDYDIVHDIESFHRGYSIAKVGDVPSLVVYTPIDNHLLSVVMSVPLAEAFHYNIIISGVLLIGFIVALLLLYFWKKNEDSIRYGNQMADCAATDELTGLKNRYWLSTAEMESVCNQYLTILFFDVDNFKQFNDLNNHQYGDAVLQFVSHSMFACTRPNTDMSVRYAGDEFLILFRDTPCQQVEIIARRLMSTLAEYKNAEGEVDAITISCGIAQGQKDQVTLEDLISRADNASYVAKKSGKNQACVWDETMA